LPEGREAMEPRALLERAFINPDAARCVRRVFDEAWVSFGVDGSNAEAIRLAKANVAHVVLATAVRCGTQDMDGLRAAVFGLLRDRTDAHC
jgi:hypothetical protein